MQAGRALAALAVLGFHLSSVFAEDRYKTMLGAGPAANLITALFRHGNLGVDFFFVLSGFIILNAHRKDIGVPARWTTYVWRRVARVYPIYWIYLSVFCGLLLLGLGEVARPPDNPAAWLSAFTLIRFSEDVPPLHVAWTLFYEVQFYFLFSLLILNVRVGVVAISAWAAICLALFHYTGESDASALVTYTSAYNLEFLFGMGAYWLYRRGRGARLLVGLGAAILVAASVWVAVAQHVSHDLFGLGFGFLIAGATILEAQGKLRTPSWLVEIGAASYSLYLIHVPVSGLLLKIGARTGLVTGSWLGALAWCVVFVLTVGAAYLAWLVVERPLQEALKFRSAPFPLVPKFGRR